MPVIDKLRQIQREYFAIYDEWLLNDLKDAEELDAHGIHRLIERKCRSGIYCVENGVALTAFEYRLIHFSNHVDAFWRSRSAEVSQLLLAQKGWHVQLPYAEYAQSVESVTRRLACYFDTVVVFDRILPWVEVARQMYFREVFRENFVKAAIIHRLRGLALTDYSPPLVVITNLPDIDRETTAYSPYISEFLSTIFGRQVAEATMATEWARALSATDAAKVLASAQESEIFNQIAAEFDTASLSRAIWDFSKRTRTWDVSKFSKLEPRLQVQAFLLDTTFMMLYTIESQLAADSVAADVLVGSPRWTLYQWLVTRLGEKALSRPEATQEQLAAIALQRPELEFLGDISIDELAEFRAHGGLADIRKAMWEDRTVIKTAQFASSELAVAAVARLVDAIETFSTELRSLVKAGRRRRLSNLASLACGLTLGVASVVEPSLGVPSAILGTAIGTKSLLGVVSENVKVRREIQLFSQRPLAILFRLRRQRRQASRSSAMP